MKLCIITDEKSQFSSLLESSFEESETILFDELPERDINGFDAIALLCGATGKNKVLISNIRLIVEEQLRLGKRIFAEACQLIGDIRTQEVVRTRYDRPVIINDEALEGLPKKRILLDEQSNERIRYANLPENTVPIAQYVHNPEGFYSLPEGKEPENEPKDYALFLASPNLLMCSFRLSNFASAKFSPRDEWASMISAIVRWLGGKCENQDVLSIFEGVYKLGNSEGTKARTVAQDALKWLDNADMLVRSCGKVYAVKEGLGANVYPDGRHAVLEQVRPDCAGEISLAYYMNWLLTGEERMLQNADGLMRFVTDTQVKTPGPNKGMERWTPSSWCVCYQDDAARSLLLPGLWRAYIGGDERYLPEVKECLDFLLSTTGSDGLRFSRTDYISESKDVYTVMGCRQNPETRKWSYSGGPGKTYFTSEELRSIPADVPSAHYNAYYMASLLLYYLITKDKKYYDAGVKGMRSIMAHYPETAREHSETQELCRLMLPLSILWKATDDPEMKSWLYMVARDLNAHRHKNGGFCEWDTGYIACCAGVKGGESSVLSENGDPVSDLLYSVNWLPIAVTAAYYFTGDEYFAEMKDYVARFFIDSQIRSDDKIIDGIWPRSIDLDRHEVYGVPNDVGWAPWSVETGWTVGEIVAGLLLGELEEKVRDRFSK